MSELFVVLGERGEYSNRLVWVSGVFTTEEAAQKAILAAMDKRRVYEAWREQMKRALPRKNLVVPYTKEEQKEASEKIGPQPADYEYAERVSIVKVTLNTWGIYDE